MKKNDIYFKLFLICTTGIFTVLLLKYNPGLSEDSISYLYAAKGLISNGSLVNIDGSPFVHWPPLMPILTAVLLLAGEKSLLLLPLFSILLSLIAFWKLTEKISVQNRTRLIVLFVFALHFAFVYSAPMLWSDLLFLALLMFFLSAIKENKSFPVAALFVLMSLLRYAGLFFLPILILYFFRNQKSTQSLKYRIILIIISLLPISSWLLYTYLVSGHLSGSRIFPAEYFNDNLQAILSELGMWLIPSMAPYPLKVIAAIFIFILPIWLIRKYTYFLWAHLSYGIGLIGTYFLFDMQHPDARLLLPLLPGFLLSVAILYEKSFEHKKTIALAILFLWTAYSALRGGKLLVEQFDGELGKYNSAYWQKLKNSNLCTSINSVQENRILISNDAHGVNYLCDKESISWPKDIHFTSDHLPKRGIFIWFRQQDPYRLYTSTAILSVYRTDTIIENENWILLDLDRY